MLSVNGPMFADQLSSPEEDPEWTNYEEIEPYIRRDYGTLFWRVIPTRIRSYVFAPTNAAAEDLRVYRRYVCAEYESILTFIAGSYSRPEQRDLYSPADEFERFVASVIGHQENSRLLVPSIPFHSFQSLDEYRKGLVAAIEQHKSVVKRCEQLLSKPRFAFLRETEQQDLEAIQLVLNKIVNSAQQCIQTIKKARSEIDRCERGLAVLSEQANPYLRFTMFLSDETLIEEAESLRDSAVAAQQSYPLEHLPGRENKRLDNCADKAASLSQQLRDSQVLFADMYAMRLRELSVSTLAMFEGWDNPVQTDDSQPEIISKADMTVEELLAELAAFRSGPSQHYVADHRLCKLATYESELSEQSEWIQCQITEWQDELRAVEQQTAQYLTLEEYLQNINLINKLARLQSRIAVVVRKAPLSVFAHAVVREVATIDKRASELKQGLERSQKQFAQSEIQRLEQQCMTILDGFKKWSGNHIERDIETCNLDEGELKIGTVVSEIAEFLTAPYRTHVGDERVEFLLQLQKEVARQERTAAETIKRINQRLRTVEQEASPYLELEEYLNSEELLEKIWDLQGEIASLRHQIPITLLTEQVYDEFKKIESDVPALAQKLQHSRRRFAVQQYERSCESVKQTLTEIRGRIEPAKKHGEPIESPKEIKATLKQAHTRIKQTRTASWGGHLTDNELATLEELNSQISKQEDFIAEKLAFEEKLETQRDNYEQLRAEAAPYLAYDRYLTRPARAELINSIERFKSEVDAVADEIRFELLADADRDRLHELKQEAISINSHLTGYNRVFVSLQRKECASLFSGIGPDNFGLTEQQERAVIRNGVYNQVIAGAGTGKTLALIYRVAYLIFKRGIDPDKIAIVTLTNKATDEIENRLATRFDITGVRIQTLHKFGLELAQDAATEKLETASGDLRNQIDRLINGDGHEQFKTHLRQFIKHDQADYLDEDDFETRADYVAERANKDYLTLAGEEVASRAEKVIADFLFENQITYRYEEVAEWADTAPDKKSYEPDFHLPEHDLYLEHWAIDEDGEVPAWFDMPTNDYSEKRIWAREQFESVDATLIETYDSEHYDGNLRSRLKELLLKQDVELEPLSFKQLVDHAHEYHTTEKRLEDQFKLFVQNAKIFSKTPGEIRDVVSEATPSKYHFAYCGAYLLSTYESFLNRTGRLDFQDMLSEAAAAIERHPKRFQDRFDHLLVDEFQDVSALGHRLISALVPSNQDDIRLFTVGDDWQSIYGFRGAVVNQFLNFEDVFGQATQTKLTQNHRSPDPIVRAGNELLRNNSNQIEKTVEPAGTNDTEPVLHIFSGKNGNDRDYRRRVGKYVSDLICSFINDDVAPDEIMILCRFDQGARYLNRIKKSLKGECIPFDGKHEQYRPDESADHHSANGSKAVQIHTIHKAKGREAEKVILVHAASGMYGLPAERDQGELLAPARDVEINRIAEERRLFYVAITRAKDELHVTTRRHQRSRYTDEISEWFHERRSAAYPGPDGHRTSLTAKVEYLWDTHTTQHQVGLLTDPTGAVKFVSWERANPATLKRGRWYRLDGLKINDSDEYGMQVIIDEKTVVEDPIDSD